MAADENDDDGLMVISDLTPDGTYVLTVQAGPDTAIVLDRDQAVAYALTVIRAATVAEHDAGVYAQLLRLGVDATAAGLLIVDLRSDRPTADYGPTAPLRFIPIVAAKTSRPVVSLLRGDEQIGQLSPDDARGHAMHVLAVSLAVDLDAAYYQHLTNTIGIDQPRARAAVATLFHH